MFRSGYKFLKGPNGYHSQGYGSTLPQPAPDAPVPFGLVADLVDHQSARLRWQIVDPGELVEEYLLEVSTNLVDWVEYAASVTEKTVSGLDAETTYYARVRSSVQGSQSAPSPAISFTTAAAPGGAVCAPPAGLSATNVQQTTAVLNWSTVANAGQFNVEYRLVGVTMASTATVQTTSLSISGLLPGNVYEFRVQTDCDAVGTSAWTAWSQFTTATAGSQPGTTYGTGTSGETYQGTVYYVDATNGNDSNSGLNEAGAVKTLARVQALLDAATGPVSFRFRRGRQWVGSITTPTIPNTSATKHGRVRFGAYGTGTRPSILGSDNLANRSWTSEGNGVYSLTISLPGAGALWIDGQMKYPVSSPMQTSTGTSTTSISSPYLQGKNFVGAQVSHRGSKYTAETKTITGHAGNTIQWSGETRAGTEVGNGFYILNHPDLPLSEGDWYYWNGVLYYKTPGGGPPAGTIFAPQYAHGIDMKGDHVEVADLSFRYFYETGLNKDCDDVVAKFFDIKSCYGAAFWNEYLSNDLVCHDFEIADCSGTGMYLDNLRTGELYRFYIHDIAMGPIYGRSLGVRDARGGSHNHFHCGISLKASEDVHIHDGEVKRIGYNGIRTDGRNHLAERLFLQDVVQKLADGGGMYCFSGTSARVPTVDCIWRDIVVERAPGNFLGYNNPGAKILSICFYHDNWTERCSIIDCFGTDPGEHVVYSNTGAKNNTYRNVKGYGGRYGLTFHNAAKASNQNEGNTIEDCAWMVLTPIDSTHFLNNKGPADYLPGAYARNTYIHPYSSEVVKVQNNGAGSFNLAQWVAKSGETGAVSPDLNWTFTNETTSRQNQIYRINPTSDPVTVNLPSGSWKDSAGQIYSGTVTLQPFEGKLFYRNL